MTLLKTTSQTTNNNAMNVKKKFKYLFIAFLLLTVSRLHAQVVVDTTNDLTTYIFNVKFKIHKMQDGESVLALSKVYNTPLEQIFAYNVLDTFIKPGTQIKIPVGNYPHKNLTDTIICCLHKIKKHESLHNIAKMYGISAGLLLEYNPQIKLKGLKRGKYLKIPEIKYSTDFQDQFFIYHPYRKGETPQIISIYYSVPIEDINTFNTDSNYTPGKIIIIPKKHYNPQEVSILRADYITLPDFTGLHDIFAAPPANPPCRTYKHTPDKQYNIALIMPFYISENSFDIQNQNKIKLYGNSELFYQYLFGVFMALDELKQLGINIDLHIYDSRNSTTRIKNILNRDEMQNMDLIIGPVYSRHYDIIPGFSQKYGVSFVSPLSRKQSVIDSNPNVFLANPSDMKLMKRTAQYIAPIADTTNIIVLHNMGNSQNLASAFERDLKHFAFTDYMLDSVIIQNVYFDPTNSDDYQYLFRKDTVNYVVIPVSNEVFVNGALNYLSALQSLGYPIVVFGMPTWEQFRNFDLQWFINLKIHYPSAYYLDKNNPAVISFREKYINVFHSLPTYYSYLGYDITMFFAHALKQYGKTFQYCLSPFSIEPSNKGIYMNFEFEKDSLTSGYENNAVFILYYDENLQLKKSDYITDPNKESEQY